MAQRQAPARADARERRSAASRWRCSCRRSLLLLLTTTAPLVYLVWNSLQRIDLGMPWLSGFAGLDNYAKMGGDPRFWNSLLLTVVYTGSTVVLQVVIGLSLALLVLQIPKGQGVLRIAAILPIVLAPVVVGLFWRTLVLAPDFGLVDLVTRSLGLGSHNWLGDPQLALISVIAIHTWQWTPFAFLVLLATLATLPPDVYEAARLDRAGAWQRFVYITLPLIRPAIVMVVILRMMTALSAFAAIFAATGGGPGSATEILNLYAYRTSFTELNLGYGASLAVVLLSITLAISWLMFRLRQGTRMNRHARTCAAWRWRPSPASARGLGVPGAVGRCSPRSRPSATCWPIRRSWLFTPTLDNYREVMFGALVDPAQPVVEPRRVDRRDAADDAVRRAGGLRAGAAALSRPSARPASTCWPRRCCRRSG